jgi:hypothetical protein
MLFEIFFMLVGYLISDEKEDKSVSSDDSNKKDSVKS